jgi:hypothetical protein
LLPEEIKRRSREGYQRYWKKESRIWCDGSKKKPYLSNERVIFTNSDPRLIRLSCASLK